ncbi:MAG: hypothetical protein WAL45_21005, partial [Terracidiphilus sp.]
MQNPHFILPPGEVTKPAMPPGAGLIVATSNEGGCETAAVFVAEGPGAVLACPKAPAAPIANATMHTNRAMIRKSENIDVPLLGFKKSIVWGAVGVLDDAERKGMWSL